MFHIITPICFTAYFIVHGQTLNLNVQPNVELPQGTLLGLYRTSPVTQKPYAAFLGIPYAEPPVDHLRFHEPVEAKKWLGIWNATEQPPDCLQYMEGQTDWRFEVSGSEDCLYLNVYTPQLEKTAELLKVIVYIHGGAFMFLSSNYSGPEYLLDRNVVVVTLNYRLGPLGFLSTGDCEVPGNNGLKDQNVALKWVKNHIKSFGGNPNDVTIAGESAGSASVIYHVLSKQSKGLFKRVIAMSGSPLNPWAFTEAAPEKAKQIAAAFGCPTSPSGTMIKCLRNRPVQTVVRSSKLLMFVCMRPQCDLFQPWIDLLPFSPYGPVVEPNHDKAFLDASPMNILVNGKASDVPLLISFCDEEGIFPGRTILNSPAEYARLQRQWAQLLPLLLDYNHTVDAARREIVAQQIAQKYRKDDPKQFIQMTSDRMFNPFPTARIFSERNNSPVYSFRFRYAQKSVPPNAVYKGVGHGDDIPFILRETFRMVEGNEDDWAVSQVMTGIWMDFISDQMPANWTTIKAGLPKFSYKVINGVESTNFMQSEDNAGNEAFWNSLKFKENTP